MKWQGRRGSSNVRDARGERVVSGSGGLAMIVNLVLRMFGLKGLLVVAVGLAIAWLAGAFHEKVDGRAAADLHPLVVIADDQFIIDNFHFDP